MMMPFNNNEGLLETIWGKSPTIKLQACPQLQPELKTHTTCGFSAEKNEFHPPVPQDNKPKNLTLSVLSYLNYFKA